MSKQYYAYIPFVASQGATELENGVRAWQNNVASVRQINENAMKSIAKKKELIDREMTKGEDRDFDSIKWWRDNIKEMEQALESGPTLREEKRPILLRHGNGSLNVLNGKNPNDYVLYIVGHCAKGSTTIRETQSRITSQDALTAQQLVDRLGADRMPKDILNIKLLSCFGAASHMTDTGEQKAFSDQFWRVLRGYCTSLVRLTAYSEPILITSFYKDKNLHKAYAHVPDGTNLTNHVVRSAGALSAVGKKYVARPCTGCGHPVQARCKVCKREFCWTCYDEHAPNQICSHA